MMLTFPRFSGWQAGWCRRAVAVLRVAMLLGAAVPVQGKVEIRVVTPGTGTTLAGTVSVGVQVTAELEIVRVTAEVAGQTVPLEYSIHAFCVRTICTPGWIGSLSLSSLPLGPATLRLVAEDGLGGRAVAEVPFVHAEPPELELLAPTDRVLRTRSLRISASARDPGGQPVLLEAKLGTEIIARATNQLDLRQAVDAGADFEVLNLSVTASNTAGLLTTRERSVRLMTDPRLAFRGAFPEPIHQITAERVLGRIPEAGGAGDLVIHDRASGRQERIPGSASAQDPRLTADGAVFWMPTAGGDTVFEWNGTRLIEAGPGSCIEPGYTLTARGEYAIWNCGSTLVLRDLRRGTNVVITGAAGNNRNDLAPNGDVVFWSNAYRVHRYRQGVLTEMSASIQGSMHTYPLTDGTNVVWRRMGGPGGPSALCVRTGAGELLTLTPDEPRSLEPGRDYAVAGGWIAFNRLGPSGVAQVWLRDPSGSVWQTTYFATHSGIVALNGAGDLIAFSGARNYLARTNGPPVALIPPVSVAPFWEGRDVAIAVDGSVFGVPRESPPALRVWGPPRAMPFVEVWGAAGQDVALQSGPDLASWVDVATFTTGATSWRWSDPEAVPPSGPRFYRVRTR